MDDYIHRRRDKSRLHRETYKNIKGKTKGDDTLLFDDGSEEPKNNSRGFSTSIFSFFRRRIPDEEEVEKKEAKKHKAEELATFEDDGDVPPEVIAKQVQKAQQAQPKVEVVDDDYEIEEDVPPLEKKEGGFMNKLFGFGSKKQEQDEEQAIMMQQQQQQNIEDLKETIKVLHKWLEKLPPEKIYEFKHSPDFEKYKDGLRKLGLIKE